MKSFARAITALLIVLVLTVTGIVQAAGRRICRGPWVQWGLIVPGYRLGEFRLGSDGLETLQKLAKPDAVDSGKSETRQVWKWAEDERFFVHMVTSTPVNGEADAGVTIDLIRFSYPGLSTYKTANEISTGSTLEQIRKSFPDAEPVSTMPTIYDDMKKGIAFEFEKAPIADSPLNDFDRLVAVNLRGVFVMTKHAIPVLLKSDAPSVINISSASAVKATLGFAPYSATKAAIITLTKVGAAEYAARGLRMNVILPGVIETPLSTALFADHPEFKETMVAQHPIGHLGQPSDIAAAVAFLASDDAKFITGAELAVDGGLTAT